MNWNMLQSEGGEIMGLKDVAKRYALHPESVRRMARRGQLPGAFKVGNRWRVNPDKLKERWG